MRRAVAILVIVIVGLWAGLAVGSGSPGGHIRVDRVEVVTLNETKTLEGTDSEFQSIYNTNRSVTTYVGILVVARGRMVVNISANVEGGPVDFRVTNRDRVLFPSAAHFDPQGNGTSFSYTFVAHGSRDAKCHYIDPEWRAAAGEAVTLTDLVVTITHNRDFKRNGEPIACPA